MDAQKAVARETLVRWTHRSSHGRYESEVQLTEVATHGALLKLKEIRLLALI